MGKNSCNFSPKRKIRTPNGVVTKTDPLYIDIKNYMYDRKDSLNLWAYSQTSEFREKYGNLSNSDTLNTLIDELKLEKIHNERQTLKDKRDFYELGPNDNPNVFNRDTAVDKMNFFNKNEDKYKACVVKAKDGFSISTDKTSNANLSAAKRIAFRNEVYNKYLDLLNELGFTIDIVNDPNFDGLFDPTSDKFLDGMIAIIQIASGERGEEAFPEEFSHFIIEGLRESPLTQRLLNSLTDEDVRTILGDDYLDYSRKYNNNMNTLRKEAAGKLLAKYIKGDTDDLIGRKKSLLSRLWEFIKSLFTRVSNDRLYEISEDALNAVNEIYHSVENRSFLSDFNSEFLKDADQLFKINSNIKTLANEAAKLAIKQTNIDNEFNINGDMLNKEDVQAFRDMANEIDEASESEKRASIGLEKYLNYLKSRLAKVQRSLKSVIDDVTEGGDIEVSSIKEFDKMRRVAAIVNSAEDIISGNMSLVQTLMLFDEPDAPDDLTEGLDELSLRDGNGNVDGKIIKIANKAKEYNNLMVKLASDVQDLRKKLLFSFVTTTTGLNSLKLQSGVDINNILSLEDLLSNAYRDVSFMNRWLGSLATCNDLILNAVYKSVEKKKAERDEMIAEDVMIAGKLLEKLDGSTDFMYQRDKDGKLTGFLVNPYDWDGYREYMANEYKKIEEKCRKSNGEINQNKLIKERNKLRKRKVLVNGKWERLMVRIYYRERQQNEDESYVPGEWVPNPKIFNKNANVLNSLTERQKEYYNKMLEMKCKYLASINKNNQGLYRAPYISKSSTRTLLHSTNLYKTGKEILKKKFTRRADDLGFGDPEAASKVKSKVLSIVTEAAGTTLQGKEKSAKMLEYAKEIKKIINDNLLNDEYVDISESLIRRILLKKNYSDETKVEEIFKLALSQNFYSVSTTLNGKILNRVPMHYATPFTKEEMDTVLDTDFGRAANAMIASYANYISMNEISDVIETMNNFLSEERTYTTRGGDLKANVTKLMRRTKTEVDSATQPFVGSNGYGAFKHFIDSAIYDRSKEDSKVFSIGKVTIDSGKCIDAIREYTSKLGLSSNLFSATSNLLAGKMQQWLEANAGEFFDWEDYAWANKEYTYLMGEYMAKSNKHINDSKLGLLIEKFDALEDFYEKIAMDHHDANALYRFISNSSIGFFGLHAGEHMLHCTTMLAMLHNIKVTKDGQTKTLYEIIDVKETKVEGSDVTIRKLKIEDGYTVDKKVIDVKTGEYRRDNDGNIRIDKRKVDNSLLIDLKLKVNTVNRTMNGAFNNDDKGEINRYAIGRCVMQFRQWMIRHYSRRLSDGYYDTTLESWREGYYVTLYNVIKDLNYAKILSAFSDESDMPEWQRANIRRAVSEIALFLMLNGLCLLVGSVKDKDWNRMTKMMVYQLYRMKMETGASFPPTMIGDLWDMLQKPMAFMGALEKASEVAKFWHIFDTVKSGTYKGWNVWLRDVYKATPDIGQLGKFYYFDDSIFRMFE